MDVRFNNENIEKLCQYVNNFPDIYKPNSIRILNDYSVVVYKITTGERVKLILTDNGTVLENLELVGV
ncbi:MAG: hypothetical protein H9W82_12475 [Lactobacillus sp.]|nr:hypothetical protein [Lactobacillus sp.]